MPDLIVLSEASIATAWNVQGDLHRADFAAAATRCFGVALPETPNTVVRNVATAAFWLGPRSWLLLADASRHRDVLAEAGGVAFDVSASRVGYTIAGPQAATLLARHCPLDFDRQVFAPGTCAQSLFGQVNALFYRHIAADAFTLLVARSFDRGVIEHLRTSAAQFGYAAAASRPFVAD
ncbi:MAG: sarcosine oxidase subunit gamma family protein [Betaproteobacteria bacterium]